MEEILKCWFAINWSSRDIHSNKTLGKNNIIFRTDEYLYKSPLMKIRNFVLKLLPQILSKNS